MTSLSRTNRQHARSIDRTPNLKSVTQTNLSEAEITEGAEPPVESVSAKTPSYSSHDPILLYEVYNFCSVSLFVSCARSCYAIKRQTHPCDWRFHKENKSASDRFSPWNQRHMASCRAQQFRLEIRRCLSALSIAFLRIASNLCRKLCEMFSQTFNDDENDKLTYR